MTIAEIVQKAINDHLVKHVNVGDDKRCRIDILAEQIEREVVPKKVYKFMYNSCIHESAPATISIHRTKEGAYKSLKKFVLEKYTLWLDLDRWHKKEFGTHVRYKMNQDQWWGIKSEVLMD